jgi:hypothetical protein
MRITIPYPRSVNNIYRSVCGVDRAHSVRVILTPQAKQYKDTAGWRAKQHARWKGRLL